MRMVPRDKRHVGQSEKDFAQHYRIFKDTDREKPWTLLLHVAIARWRWLGSYETQQEAISAVDHQ
jgi:hypothetical protein